MQRGEIVLLQIALKGPQFPLAPTALAEIVDRERNAVRIAINRGEAPGDGPARPGERVSSR